MCHSAELVLDCRPDVVAIGRHFLADALLAWGGGGEVAGDAVLDDVLIVASELLGNAARYCTEEIRLVVEVHASRVRVGVTDNSPEPAVAQPLSASTVRGRGLAIVSALSERWGQSPFDGATKSVWADVVLPAGSALTAGCRPDSINQ